MFELLADYLGVTLILFFLCFLFSFGYKNDHFALALAPGAAQSLHHANGRRHAIIRNDQVNFADVESLLSNAGRNQSVENPATEFLRALFLLLLRDTVVALAEEQSASDQIRLVLVEKFFDLARRVTIVGEDEHFRIFLCLL